MSLCIVDRIRVHVPAATWPGELMAKAFMIHCFRGTCSDAILHCLYRVDRRKERSVAPASTSQGHDGNIDVTIDILRIHVCIDADLAFSGLRSRRDKTKRSDSITSSPSRMRNIESNHQKWHVAELLSTSGPVAVQHRHLLVRGRPRPFASGSIIDDAERGVWRPHHWEFPITMSRVQIWCTQLPWP